MAEPVVLEIRGGWLAKGEGWAVRGVTKEDALEAFAEAELRHTEIDARPLPGNRVDLTGGTAGLDPTV